MISLSMIVKNEEKHLRGCLESVKGVVDEIILVDTGSTDGTIKIAEEFGAKIFHFNWINDFAAARNFSLSNCKGDWILYLDADERLSEKSIAELKRLTAIKKKAAYYCQVRSIDDKNDRPSLMSYVRLFVSDNKINFEGAVHEQIENSLRQNKFEIKNSNIEILHIGYNLDKDGLQSKAKRNLEILLKEFEKKKNSYYAFQLGQTYGILNDKISAIKYFKIALEDSLLSHEYKSTAYRYIAIDHAEKQEWNDALENITNSIRNDDQQPLALLTAAKIFVKLKNFANAEEMCMKAFEVNSKLLKNGIASSQTIFLNQKDFLINALGIAIQSENTKMFNYFYERLKLSDLKQRSEDLEIELRLYDVLLNKKSIEQNESDLFIQIINQNNLDLILAMLDKYEVVNNKIILLEKLSEKLPDNSIILNKLGLVLASIKEFTKAEIYLEQSVKINPNDPSAFFYLISVYLQENKINSIISLIEAAESKFSNMNFVLDKLKLIKQKLNL